MHYLIYLPETSGADPEHLRSVGLEGLLRDGDDGPKSMEIDSGPDGHSGQIVSWRQAGEPFAYQPDRQEWWPCRPDPVRELPGGRFWIGSDRDASPTPEDLLRSEPALIHGLPMVFGDGNEWMLPNYLNVPHHFELDADGRPDRSPKPAFRPLYEEALDALRVLEGVLLHDEPLDWAWGYDYASRMLAVNYRVTPEIVGWLKLLDDDNLPSAIARTTDAERIFQICEQVKKKDSASTPTGSEQSPLPEDSCKIPF